MNDVEEETIEKIGYCRASGSGIGMRKVRGDTRID